MADATPTPKSSPVAADEPVATEVVETAPADPLDQPATETVAVDPADPVVDPDAPAAVPVTPTRVVFVESPRPPQLRGNRGAGAALALLGAVVFALAFAAGAAVLIAVTVDVPTFSSVFSTFVQTSFYWVPILFFALGFVLLTLLVNRASWWVHVLGSLVVALFVYFASIGMLLILDGLLAAPGEGAARFAQLATNPIIVLAAFLAREVSIWIGLAIAARGRRVRARNTETLAAFERDVAEKRAEHERAAAAAV
jgi:hypothetical protein